MSNVNVSIERVNALEPHPNADRLEIARILGTQTIVPKGQYRPGQKVVFFPPDILLPGAASEALGVQKYLKSAMFDGLRIPCRVAACRLRGVPSYGFIAPIQSDVYAKLPEGSDVSEKYGAKKYEPPVRAFRGNSGVAWGGLAPEPPEFHRYTDIQHYWKYAAALEPGTLVRVTEKLHGTNSRVGVIKVDGEWQFMAGSHKTARKQFDPEGKLSLYWRPLELEGVLALLNALCDERSNVILFGELYGPGIQDLDYGVPAGEVGYRVFDISLDGHYLRWPLVSGLCNCCNVPTVPLLYEGPFLPDQLQDYTNGPATYPGANKFKGREGCVITPFVEQYSSILGGRLILKSVSADYLDRKGAKDEGEV
jgi:RNA ligase (TIGR02306 family)